MSSGSPSATPLFKTSARNPLPPVKACTTTKGIPGVPAGDSSVCPHKQTWLESQNQEQSLSKKQMLHKTRARNARPYGYGGIMRSSFFRNIVGARIARPLLEFVQNFGFAHLLSRNSSILSFAERAGAVRLKLNISRNKCLSILDMGFCPIAPPKGFPFSIVCFCHWQQQPKTSLETFGRKYLVLFLKYRCY